MADRMVPGLAPGPPTTDRARSHLHDSSGPGPATRPHRAPRRHRRQRAKAAKARRRGEPYLILGACNPPLAHAALEAEPKLGVLLPCNVVVYQEQGRTHLAAVDAEQMRSIVDNDELAPTAAAVRQRLAAVVERAAEN